MVLGYFASDVAYHKNKLDRKFDYLINILGADHAGYIKEFLPQLKLYQNKRKIDLPKVSQLVKLIKIKSLLKCQKKGIISLLMI